MPPKAEEKKNFRSKLVTSQQQLAYTQTIKKEEWNASNTVAKDLRRLEPISDDPYRIPTSVGSTQQKISDLGPALQEPYTYEPKDAKDKMYSRKQFLNQALGKDTYKVPIKSNDTYGWLPPIDTFVQCGYGLTIYEGGTEFTKPLFRGPQKEKAPAK